MSNNKKYKKWDIVWIPESKYNSYKNVSTNKMRPVLIWARTLLFRRYICFHCTTNKSNYISEYMLNIGKLSKKENNTFINLTKIYMVNKKDINRPYNVLSIANKKIKKNIKSKIKDITDVRYFWRDKSNQIKIANKKK
ncbi:MAG: hypothetical protein ACRC42_00760 [Mycoplasma sp.]